MGLEIPPSNPNCLLLIQEPALTELSLGLGDLRRPWLFACPVLHMGVAMENRKQEQ